VGPETLDLLVSPIYDDNNVYLGPMVTWEIITKKLEGEREMARINSMMENSPINVMYADRDLNIQYLNPASKKTLKKLEHLLPISVDQMMGQNIDIFHKNPSHQRNLLSDPTNLPRQANIKLGDETITYTDIAKKLNLSNGALRLQVMRMRRALREQLERKIAETVDSPESIDEELRYLVGLLRS